MLPSRDRKGVGMALRAAEFNEDVSGEQARKINELQSVFNRVVTKTNCFAVHPSGGNCVPRNLFMLCGLTNSPTDQLPFLGSKIVPIFRLNFWRSCLASHLIKHACLRQPEDIGTAAPWTNHLAVGPAKPHHNRAANKGHSNGIEITWRRPAAVPQSCDPGGHSRVANKRPAVTFFFVPHTIDCGTID